MHEVSRAHILGYQEALYLYRKKDGRPISHQTQCSRLSPVVVWFRWLVKQKLILVNPASDLEMPRLGRRLHHRAFSEAEVEAVLASIDVSTALGIRNRAIFETFYSTGLRRFELCALRIPDVDFERGTVFVLNGKGQKQRVVPIGQRALSWLRRYLDAVRPTLARGNDHERWLFLSVKARPLAPDVVTRLGETIVRAAGFDHKGAACHVFRHTAATLMLERGADIRVIQEFLGHQCLDTTQVYTKVTQQRLKEVHARTHPAAADTDPEDDTDS